MRTHQTSSHRAVSRVPANWRGEINRILISQQQIARQVCRDVLLVDDILDTFG